MKDEFLLAMQNNYDTLVVIFNSIKRILGDKEYQYRLKKLELAFQESKRMGDYTQQYYSISHEIRAISLFNKLGSIYVYKDSENEGGADFRYKDIYVECVVCTAGIGNNFDNYKYAMRDTDNGIKDYNPIFNHIILRATSSLQDKSKKNKCDISKEYLDQNKPFCIYINLGSLSEQWFSFDYCSEATRFLLGRGNPQIEIDITSNKQNGSMTYSYVPEKSNYNNSIVCTNFFGNIENNHISAVIISTQNLNGSYSNKNTYIFTNPYAINKLVLADFNYFTYWIAINENEYCPFYDGKYLL